jgi:hypothetical protein
MTIAETIYNNINLTESLCNLYARWQEEHEYEDIADYQAVIQPQVESMGATFSKMTKRPFGFVCQAEGKTYQFKVTTREYAYKRIG